MVIYVNICIALADNISVQIVISILGVTDISVLPIHYFFILKGEYKHEEK
jgi:hypothetical protein